MSIILAVRRRSRRCCPSGTSGTTGFPIMILMAGRADLVCLARPHLVDPYWTLHQAVGLGDGGTAWPLPYLAGRDQAMRLAQRAAEVIRV